MVGVCVFVGVCVVVGVCVDVAVGVGDGKGQVPISVIEPFKSKDTEACLAHILVDAPKHKVCVPDVPSQLVQLKMLQPKPILAIVYVLHALLSVGVGVGVKVFVGVMVGVVVGVVVGVCVFVGVILGVGVGVFVFVGVGVGVGQLIGYVKVIL